MQEIKNHLKKIGEKIQGSNEAHKELLRQKLLALHPEPTTVPSKHFTWFPVLSWAAFAVVVLVIGLKFYQHPITIQKYERTVDEYSLASDLSDSAGLAVNSMRAPSPREQDSDIIAYEEDNGAMLEQSVNIRMLTQEDNASETVTALFASLGGHLSSIRANDDEYTTITGSIPASRMSFFYDQLNALVKNDAFIEKTVRGDSVTAEALDLASREEALHAAEVSVTEQLQAATTEEEKKRVQENLETISKEIAQLTKEQDALRDRVDYITVSVSIEKLPSLFRVQNEYQLDDVIAGYESPTLWQGMVINVLTAFFIAIQFLSVTFWILIPLGIFVLMHLKRRRMINELE